MRIKLALDRNEDPGDLVIPSRLRCTTLELSFCYIILLVGGRRFQQYGQGTWQNLTAHTEVAAYYGEDSTKDALNHRFRPIKKMATAMREAGPGNPIPCPCCRRAAFISFRRLPTHISPIPSTEHIADFSIAIADKYEQNSTAMSISKQMSRFFLFA